MPLLSALRSGIRSFRAFGLSEAESLMNLSTLGSLRCHCEPTDAAEPRNDRRRSCRTCGNAILMTEPTMLYAKLSKSEIRQVTRRLRRAGMEARVVDLPHHITSLSDLHLVGSLAELSGHRV